MKIKSLLSSVLCLLILCVPTWSQSETTPEKVSEKTQEKSSEAIQEKSSETTEAKSNEATQEKSSETASEQVSETIPIELPDNPEAVVLSYDITGAPRNLKEADFEPDTLFRMFANGKVIIGRDRPTATVLEYTMTKEAMNELLEEIVNKNHIFDITTEGLKKQIADTERPFFLMDAPVHQISVELANRKHEVETDGLISTRNFYKEIEQLQTFAKLHDKFVYLRGRAALGTQEQIDKLEKSMAKKFIKQYPDGEPLTIKDVTYAIIDKDGRLDAQFDRVDYEDGRPVYAYNCTVKKHDGKTTIAFLRARLR